MGNAKKFSLDDVSSYKDGNPSGPAAASQGKQNASPPPSDGFFRHSIVEDSAPLRPTPESFMPPLQPQSSTPSPLQNQFAEGKSEPSWLRKTLGHGFKLFKEDSKSRTIASISLDDINGAAGDLSGQQIPKRTARPAPTGEANADFKGRKEYTNFSRASQDFLKEEEQRRALQAKLRSQNQNSMGQLGQRQVFSHTIVTKIFMIIILAVGGLLVGRFAWKWTHAKDSKAARALRAKSSETSGKSAVSKRERLAAPPAPAAPPTATPANPEDTINGDIDADAMQQNIRPRRLK